MLRLVDDEYLGSRPGHTPPAPAHPAIGVAPKIEFASLSPEESLATFEALVSTRRTPRGAVLVVPAGDLHGNLPLHSHREPMVVSSISATAIMTCDERSWVVPPAHGMWIPSGVTHGVRVLHPGAGSALVFDPERCPVRWPEPTALIMTPLLRELIVYMDRIGDTPWGPREHAENLLFDLLQPAQATDIQLPIPKDERLRQITDGILAYPADDRDLSRWAYDVGAGVRTITRLFSVETGMTFARWRSLARVQAAITLLAEGVPVGATARRVGFVRPAAFSEAFRRVTGQPPSAFSPTC